MDWRDKTKAFLDQHGITRAQDILGNEAWAQIVADAGPKDEPITIYFESDKKTYGVVTSTAPYGDIKCLYDSCLNVSERAHWTN